MLLLLLSAGFRAGHTPGTAGAPRGNTTYAIDARPFYRKAIARIFSLGGPVKFSGAVLLNLHGGAPVQRPRDSRQRVICVGVVSLGGTPVEDVGGVGSRGIPLAISTKPLRFKIPTRKYHPLKIGSGKRTKRFERRRIIGTGGFYGG